MNVINKDNGKNGVFMAVEDGVQLGEMSYVWGGDNKIIIDHTNVAPQYKGQGIGKCMFNEAVSFARNKQIKIIPVCPFVVALFKRVPEAKDVLEA